MADAAPPRSLAALLACAFALPAFAADARRVGAVAPPAVGRRHA